VEDIAHAGQVHVCAVLLTLIIQIKYMEMNEYLFKCTTNFRKYNKMKVKDGDGDGDGVDATVDDGDYAQASNDLSPFSSYVLVDGGDLREDDNGGGGAAELRCGGPDGCVSLPCPLPYIGLTRRAPRTSQYRPYGLGKTLGMSGGQNGEETYIFWKFLRPGCRDTGI
jgi:hypothetical protein